MAKLLETLSNGEVVKVLEDTVSSCKEIELDVEVVVENKENVVDRAELNGFATVGERVVDFKFLITNESITANADINTIGEGIVIDVSGNYDKEKAIKAIKETLSKFFIYIKETFSKEIKDHFELQLKEIVEILNKTINKVKKLTRYSNNISYTISNSVDGLKLYMHTEHLEDVSVHIDFTSTAIDIREVDENNNVTSYKLADFDSVKKAVEIALETACFKLIYNSGYIVEETTEHMLNQMFEIISELNYHSDDMVRLSKLPEEELHKVVKEDKSIVEMWFKFVRLIMLLDELKKELGNEFYVSSRSYLNTVAVYSSPKEQEMRSKEPKHIIYLNEEIFGKIEDKCDFKFLVKSVKELANKILNKKGA